MNERRKIRSGLRVVHRHRVADLCFLRVSELVFLNDEARAVLGWINSAGIRMPLYSCPLDRTKLRRPRRGPKDTYYYDETTVDPRYDSP